MRWLHPAAYPTLLMLSVVSAWMTFDLVQMATVNASFLAGASMLSMAQGDIVMLGLIAAKGMIASLCYLGFKGIEREVVTRWLGRG